MRPASITLLAPLLLALLTVSPAADADSEEVGEALNILLPAAALGATFLVEDESEGTWQFLRAAVVAELTTELLKTTIDKERPNGDCCTAFPSGHATRAFYAAGFIDERYGRRYGLPAYALAAVVAWSRVDADQHDEADVIGGALVGWLSARYFTSPRVEVRPMAGAPGLALAWRF